ncbi:MAG: hypothetical protein KF774_18105 [Planctomyces sp.]|nr:hypothetical protein [Planctomyces sp.]
MPVSVFRHRAWPVWAALSVNLLALVAVAPVPARRKIELPEPFRIEITGAGKQWQVRYPDLDLLGGPDAAIIQQDIPVPGDRELQFVLKSEDYVYTLEIPAHQKKEIAVPTLEFRMTLEPQEPGTLEYVGEPMCNDPHSPMNGRLIIESADRFLDRCEQAADQRDTAEAG